MLRRMESRLADRRKCGNYGRKYLAAVMEDFGKRQKVAMQNDTNGLIGVGHHRGKWCCWCRYCGRDLDCGRVYGIAVVEMR